MAHRMVVFAAACMVASIVYGDSTARAGWVLTESNGDETIISEGKMKTAWENGTIIFDASTHNIHFLDERRKIMASGTVDELCEGVEQMVESMMADIPAEQLEMMQQMLGSATAETEVVKKGAGGKIAGFETTRYEVLLGGELFEELWVTEDEVLKKECQGLMQMLMRFSSCMSSASAMGAPSPESSPDYMKLLEAGITVKSVEHGDEGESVNTTMLSSRDVPSSAFALPADYEEVPLSKIWQSGR